MFSRSGVTWVYRIKTRGWCINVRGTLCRSRGTWCPLGPAQRGALPAADLTCNVGRDSLSAAARTKDHVAVREGPGVPETRGCSGVAPCSNLTSGLPLWAGGVRGAQVSAQRGETRRSGGARGPGPGAWLSSAAGRSDVIDSEQTALKSRRACAAQRLAEDSQRLRVCGTI